MLGWLVDLSLMPHGPQMNMLRQTICGTDAMTLRKMHYMDKAFLYEHYKEALRFFFTFLSTE